MAGHGPPRRLALLVNPVSGRGRGAGYGLRALRRLRAAGLEATALVGRDADESYELGAKAVADGYDGLVVVGGDGMVNLAAQLVAGTGMPLGVVPAGTGDDVARSLGIPRRAPEVAAMLVAAGQRRTIDLARAAGRYYVTVLASGFDSAVNERANRMRWPRGNQRYNLAIVAELAAFRPLPYTVELDGVARRVDAMLVAVGNGPSYGGGLKMCAGARLDDGLLDVVVIRPLSRARLVRVFPRLYAGTHVRLPQYEHARARTVTLAAPGVVAYADGERLTELPVTVEAVPGALTVFASATP